MWGWSTGLQKGEADDEGRLAESVKEARKDSYCRIPASAAGVGHRQAGHTEDGCYQEAHDLDRLAPELFDRQNGRVVAWHKIVNCNRKNSVIMIDTWYEAQSRNDHISRRDIEQPSPRCTGFAIKTDLLEDKVLIQVDSIKAGVAEQIGRK